MITFIEWLGKKELLEGVVQRYRNELAPEDVKKVTIDVGDMVDLGPETKYKGQNVIRLAKVVNVGANKVAVESLTNGERFDIPIDLLHSIEELRGTGLIARDSEHLQQLGGRKLWIKLNPRQYKLYKNKYKAPEPPEWLTKLNTQSDAKPNYDLKSLFTPEPKTSEVSPLDSMLKNPLKISAPLRDFKKNKNLLNL